MIKVLLIKNFQSHKDTTLELSDGVNAIIGPSDSGKTAIIRALRWLVWNRPLGDQFRSNCGGDTEAVILLGGELSEVKRQRTKTANMYILEDAISGAMLKFEAIRQDVPEEIQKTLNMNEINLQMQLDAPFLLSNSPGEVGAHFNRIAHLDIIDIGTQNVQKWKRSIEQDIRSGEQHLQQQQEELKKYAHLDEFEQRLQILETLDEQRILLYQKRDRLFKLTDILTSVEAEFAAREEILEIEIHVNQTLGLIRMRRDIGIQYSELELTLDRLAKMEEASVQLQEKTKNEGKINELLKLNDQRTKLKEKHYAFKAHIDATKTISDLYIQQVNKHVMLQAEFDEAMPDVCPLCGQEVKR